MSEIPHIDKEFIQENNKLGNSTNKTMQKKSGPKDRKARLTRRNEVYRLHFISGVSAIKISEFMKVNRNTIQSDVQFWYDKLARQLNDTEVDGIFMRQILRLEDQRVELLETLKAAETMEEKLSVRRLILDIDSRIFKFVSSISTSKEKIIETALSWINKDAEEEGIKRRYVSLWKLSNVSKHTYDEITKILRK